MHCYLHSHMLDDAKTLVAYFKDSHDWGYINFAEDWKLTTLFIGGNDLCAYCKNRVLNRSFYVCFVNMAWSNIATHTPAMVVVVVIIVIIIVIIVISIIYMKLWKRQNKPYHYYSTNDLSTQVRVSPTCDAL